MRNVFDQYRQPENQLTHALGVCLDQDRALLRAFLARVGVRPSQPAHALIVDEQRLPGEDERNSTDEVPDEDEAQRRGLPDLVIHDRERWALVVENKVNTRLTANQLDRHLNTLRGRGFVRARLMALTKRTEALPTRAIGLRWPDLYAWLGEQAPKGPWNDRLRDYLRLAEARLAEEGKLTEGTLTMFDGFKFDAHHPYNYLEAKRLLKLALSELREHRGLQRIRIDRKAPGRGAITGEGGSGVWDILHLRDGHGKANFTKRPHLSLGINRDTVGASLTIPNGVPRTMRRSLAELEIDGLTRMHREILARTRALRSHGATVSAYATQRHWLKRGSPEVVDARLKFSLATAVKGVDKRVKAQPAWTATLAKILASKRGNVQIGYSVEWPHGTSNVLRSQAALDRIVEGWCALEPVLKRLRR